MLTKFNYWIVDRNCITLFNTKFQYLLARFTTNFNKEFMYGRRHCCTTVWSSRMKRINNTIDMLTLICLDDDTLTEELLRSETSKCIYPNKSFTVDMTNNQTNFIHMCRNQNLLITSSFTMIN